MSDVLIVGSVALDSIETPAGRLEAAQGGSASYASVAASYWCDPAIVAVIGGDYPPEYLDLLRSHGVRLEPGLEIVPDGESFHWSGLYKGAMNEAVTRQTHLGVFEDFEPKVPAELAEAKYVMLGNIDPELQLSVLDQMTAPKLVVIDTMNLWIEIKREALLKVLSRSDVVVLNDGEARLLGEEINLHKCARYLREKVGCKYVIIKKGEHGAMLYGPDGLYFSLPAYPIIELKDPTGAGDSFAGGFIGYMSRQPEVTPMALRQAMVVGTAMASFCVAQFSLSYSKTLTHEQIFERIEQIRGFTAIDPVAEPVAG